MCEHVGATLSKGLNRGMATLLAGSLAIGIHWIAKQLGDQANPIIHSIAVFLLGTNHIPLEFRFQSKGYFIIFMSHPSILQRRRQHFLDSFQL